MAEARIHDPLAQPTVATRRILLIAGGCLVFLALTFIGLGLIYFSVVPQQRMPPPRTFPAPRLQPHAEGELHQLQKEQRAALDTYRWANPEHTLVAIPIERAMKLIAERGPQAYAPVTETRP
jgi:hypothetical protein